MHRERYNLDRYILVTLHRPSNVDEPETLAEIMAALIEISRQIPVLFPVHPRTRSRISTLNLTHNNNRLVLTDPMGYLDFLALQMHAALLLTDSGGIQEETTYLGIPCLTARPNTERPVTVTHGTNRLVTSQRDELINAVRTALQTLGVKKTAPELWDGMTADRIVHLFRNDSIR